MSPLDKWLTILSERCRPISHQMSIELASNKYDKFHTKQIQEISKHESDFDKVVNRIGGNKNEH